MPDWPKKPSSFFLITCGRTHTPPGRSFAQHSQRFDPPSRWWRLSLYFQWVTDLAARLDLAKRSRNVCIERPREVIRCPIRGGHASLGRRAVRRVPASRAARRLGAGIPAALSASASQRHRCAGGRVDPAVPGAIWACGAGGPAHDGRTAGTNNACVADSTLAIDCSGSRTTREPMARPGGGPARPAVAFSLNDYAGGTREVLSITYRGRRMVRRSRRGVPLMSTSSVRTTGEPNGSR
jgi:hypothetical protein